ncbi:UNVERIFIED_CONTAM: TM2 domain-containing membrane protein YozV [Brevibacillus sp. OAP136]
MNKNGIIAFFLSAIPGAAHLYLQRNVRAIVYALCFFGPLFLGFMLAFAMNDGKPMVLGIVSIVTWIINVIDVLVFLARRPAVATAQPSVIGEEEHGYTSRQPGEGAIEQRERFYTILLSPIPGLAHFQMGLMNRGVTFLVGFFGTLVMILFVTALTHQSGFLVFLGVLPVIWLYALFDAVQLVNRKHRGEVLVDRTVFEDFEQNRGEGKKSRVLAIFLSAFPGAGHMYLGLQKRGFQLMVGFLLSIYVLDVLRLSLFLFLIPLIWFYSFFDALQQLARYNRGEAQDVPVVRWLPNHQRWLGIVLLILGGYYLLDQVLFDILGQFYPEASRLAQWIETYFQTFIVSTLLIGGGIKLLLGSKPKKGV